MKLFSNKFFFMVLATLTANTFSNPPVSFQQCAQEYGHVLLAPIAQFASREAQEEAYKFMEQANKINDQQSPEKTLFGQVCLFDHTILIKECFGITQQDFFTLARSTGKDFSPGMGYLPPESFCEIETGMENYERVAAVVGGIALGAVITWGAGPLSRLFKKICCTHKKLSPKPSSSSDGSLEEGAVRQ